MTLFDIAVETRFTNSPEIGAIDLTSADIFLVYDTATGNLMPDACA